MAQLAIKGHATRGKEVIELLEMLGGKIRCDRLAGNDVVSWYYIDENGYIDNKLYSLFHDTTVFCLEKFLEMFPYKVGDKVIVKGLPEYPKNIHFMEWFDDNIHYSFDNETWFLPSALQPYKETPMYLNKKANKQAVEINKILEPVKEIMEEDSILNQLIEYFKNTPRDIIEKEWHEYDKYNEIGPTVKEYLESINKPKYPKTHEDCIKVLQISNVERPIAYGYKYLEIEALQLLLICRNAYWKIAGEQMGLGKPWEPDWLDTNTQKYCIYYVGNEIKKQPMLEVHHFLAFPTAEMRDAFYNNFKELIEQCKELL